MGHPAFVAGEASWSSLSQLAAASRLIGMTIHPCAIDFAEPPVATYAASRKGSRMKLANATNLNRKSGVAQWRDLLSSPVHLLPLVTAQDIFEGHHALEGALAGPILNGENGPTGQVGNRAVERQVRE